MIPTEDLIARGAKHGSETANTDRLALLAAVLATDPRPSLIFSSRGELLLASAAVGAALVAEWHAFGASSEWTRARDAAMRAGNSSVTLQSGLAGELNCLTSGNLAETEFYLLRLEDHAARSAAEERAERLSQMAHDLRVPLQSLMIAGEQMAERSDASAEVAALARLALDHMRNLLEMSRMDEVSTYAEPVAVFDVVALVQDMVQLLRPICAQSGNTLVLETPAGPAWQMGPGHLIRAILQNLITNANRFTKKGPITVRLGVDVSNTDAERPIHLEVEDAGPGLSANERAIFLQQSAVRPMRPRISGDGGGYGLGLGIVARAIARLRGRIEVGPGARSGTLFRMDFPLAISKGAEDAAVPVSNVSLAGLRVLVVEDNPVNLAILLRTLADAGAVAEGVISGGDALKCMGDRRAEFDLVLLDVTLPDIDGIEVARQLRGGESAATPLLIVGLTAHSGAMIHGSGLAAGMDRVLVKPVRPSELRQALWETWDGTGTRQRVQRRTGSGETMLDDDMVAELIEEMGQKAAFSFMQQALAEARGVADAVGALSEADLRSRIHSAIGSAGLTGLAGVEFGLRGLQTEVRQGLGGKDAAQALLARIEATGAELAARSGA